MFTHTHTHVKDFPGRARRRSHDARAGAAAPILRPVHILVATTGVLPPGPVAELCGRFLADGGHVTVITVIQVPRTFLEQMDVEERRSFLDDRPWESDTAQMMALGYLEERGRRAVEPIVAALRARGQDTDVRFIEGDDPAEAIVASAEELDVDLVVLGATRRLFTDQAWTSVSARVMEQAKWPVVLVPGAKSDDGDD